MLALLDFNISEAISEPSKALKDILEELTKHKGLDYVPKE
jgi:hypothetical protein